MTEVVRTELLAALRLAAKVAEKKSAIPLRSMVWLTGDHVIAHGPSVAVRIPLEVGVVGGIQPKLLIDLLNRIDNDTVEIKDKIGEAGDLLILNGGDATAKLQLADPTAFQEWDKEAWSDEEGTDLPAELFETEALKAMQSVDPVPFETAEFSSMHVDVGKVVDGLAKCTLFTSDRKTIHRRVLKIEPETLEGYTLIPLEFMELMVSEFGEVERYTATKRHVTVESNGVRLQGQLGTSQNPPNFMQACQRVWPDNTISPKLLQPLPETFGATLQRAATMNYGDDHVTLVVEDDVLRVRAKTHNSEFHEKVGPFQQSALRVRVMPKQVLRILKFADRAFITERAFILYGQDGLSFYIYAQRAEDE